MPTPATPASYPLGGAVVAILVALWLRVKTLVLAVSVAATCASLLSRGRHRGVSILLGFTTMASVANLGFCCIFYPYSAL
jgi:hypothetical protein